MSLLLSPQLTRSPSRGRRPTHLPRPIHVCFLIDRLGRAGTESQLLALIRGLDRSRFRPSLVLLDGTDVESRSLEPENCEVLRLGVARLASRAMLRAARVLHDRWRVDRPDVLQVYFMDSAYFSIPIARWVGVPRIVRVRNNLGYWLTRKHRILSRFVSRLADVTVTNSEAGKEALIAAEGLAPDRVRVLENGVDLDRFPRVVTRGDAAVVRVGCVANLRPVKNIDGLVRAAKVVCDRFPQVEFAVAGDGPERGALEALRDSLGLAGRFHFHGSVADVPGFLRELDIAVLPSHSEGMSNAVLEYLAAGKAVVATEVGANGKLLGDGQYGRLVPAGNIPALADAISRLVGDPVDTHRLGKFGRERVEREYSRAAMVRRFERFYADLPEAECPNAGLQSDLSHAERV